MVLRRVWNPIDCQGHRVKFLPHNTEFAKLPMGLVVLVKKMSVLINFLLQNTNLVTSLAKSAQILLVMSDRTDTFREL